MRSTVSAGGTVSSRAWSRWRRTVGLMLLALTVFLWTASNFLASVCDVRIRSAVHAQLTASQTIFADDTYSKPFFVTYVNTSFFLVPLIPILAQKVLRDPQALRDWAAGLKPDFRGRYLPLETDESVDGSVYTGSPQLGRARRDINASGEVVLASSVDSLEALDAKRATLSSREDSTTPLTFQQTARLSLEFCLIWFIANYFIAACLEYTTVASSTILTSTSSVFTLLFGYLFGVERFTLQKMLAVLASLTGIILISTVDFSGTNTDDEHRGDFPTKTLRELAIGNGEALLSAVLYGLYATFMKKRIPNETRINMPLFFGLVGLFNIILLWPGFFILHFSGVETWQLPPTGKVTAIILSNSTASLVSDIAWAYAVVLTSPIVVTVGLSMTIPLSLVGQMVLHSQTTSPIYWVGAIVVVLSFIFVSHEEKKDEDRGSVAGEGGEQLP